MKTTNLTSLVLIAFFSFITSSAFSQISVQSSAGYSVSINVTPKQVNVASASCTWGYNYTVKVHYQVKFYGNNIPSSLYTLQGSLGCGSNVQFFDLPNEQSSGMVNTANSWTSMTNCGTATPASLGCNMISIEIEAPGISHRTVSFAAASPLAVELVDFTAIAQNSSVQLGWETASEINNAFYSVERSDNGTDWTLVSKLTGAGTTTSQTNYTATDFQPLSGTSYYRLKQTDHDGTFSYSATRTVKLNVSGSSSVGVYPVPNSGNDITITGIAQFGNQPLQVINSAGNVVYATTLRTAKLTLPVLTTGVYFIRIQDKSGELASVRYVRI